MMKHLLYIVMGMWCVSGAMHQSLQAAEAPGQVSVEIPNPDRAKIESVGRSAKLYGPAVALALLTLAAGVSTKLAQSAEKKNLSKAAERLTGWLKFRRWLAKHGYKVTGGLGAATAAALAVGGGLDWRDRKANPQTISKEMLGGSGANLCTELTGSGRRVVNPGDISPEKLSFLKDVNGAVHLVYQDPEGGSVYLMDSKYLIDFKQDPYNERMPFGGQGIFLNHIAAANKIKYGDQSFDGQYIARTGVYGYGFLAFPQSMVALPSNGAHILSEDEARAEGAVVLDGAQVVPFKTPEGVEVYLPVVGPGPAPVAVVQ